MDTYNNLPNDGMTFETARDIRAAVCRFMLVRYKHYRIRLVSPDSAWDHARDDVEKMLELVVDCAMNDASSILGNVNEDGLLP